MILEVGDEHLEPPQPGCLGGCVCWLTRKTWDVLEAIGRFVWGVLKAIGRFVWDVLKAITCALRRLCRL